MMPVPKSILIFIFIAFFTGDAKAQAPQWQWARGIGGNHQESLVSSSKALQVDSLGNSYEVINSQSTSMVMGGVTYNNPFGTGNNVAYFVKYNLLGSVVWVKTFPLVPIANGGGPNNPGSFFTDKKGYSFLMFYFRDSIRIGGVLLVDTAIGHYNGNYCIAKYDPDGNVISINAHQVKNGGVLGIRQFPGDKILAVGVVGIGQNGNDTLNGHPLQFGTFVAVMDSIGNVLRAKSIGYDSLGGYFIYNEDVAISNHSIYVILKGLSHPHVYQANVPIGDLAPYSDPLQQGIGKNLVVKLDSLLNFQWFRTTSTNVGAFPIGDQHDNLCLLGISPATYPEDTVVINTVHIIMPYIVPLYSFGYLNIIKINGNGDFQWLNREKISWPPQGFLTICADELDNIFIAGKYTSQQIAGTDTLNGSGVGFYIAKISGNGANLWIQGTTAGALIAASGIAADGHGNVFVNGMYADPNFTVHIGTDSMICHTPVAGYPLAGDIFNARLGNCDLLPPVVTASSALIWCGIDSVALTASSAQHYLWSNGDTTQSILVNNSGNYHVLVIDSMGCYAKSAVINIVAGTPPTLSMTSVASTNASGNGLAIAISSGGTAPYTYFWNTVPAQATDTAVNLQPGWYQVTVTDMNGCLQKDSVFVDNDVIVDSTNTIEFSVMPNPALRSVTIKLGVPIENATLIVYGSDGKRVINRSINTSAPTYILNIQSLSGGIYIVELNIAKKSYRKKLVVL